MNQTEIQSRSPVCQELHFNLLNEKKNLASLPENEAITFAEGQVIHYLAEHVLEIQHPWLVSEEETGAYSYKLREKTNPFSGEKYLMPIGYDDKTSFTALCSKPYIVLSTRLAGKNPDSYSDQEKRLLKRAQAEMMGAIAFEQLTLNGKNGDLIFWSSPPGKPEDGYWDSSITYLAQIKETEKGEKQLQCYRCIHNLTLPEHVELLNQLAPFDQKLSSDSSIEDIVASPIQVDPAKCGDVNQLIDYLYFLNGKKYQTEEIQRDLSKLEKVKKAISPEIKSLVFYLQKGNKEQAGQQLDRIERKAMQFYFKPDELLQITYGESTANQQIFSLNDNDYDILLRNAHYMRRQEMKQKGSSCPSVNSESIDPITGQIKSFDPRQQLIDHLENVISSESETFKCARCRQPISGKPKKCPHCGAQTCFDPEKHKK